jgi:hypothetical protein
MVTNQFSAGFCHSHSVWIPLWDVWPFTQNKMSEYGEKITDINYKPRKNDSESNRHKLMHILFEEQT